VRLKKASMYSKTSEASSRRVGRSGGARVLLQGGEEALGDGVVVTALGAHRDGDAGVAGFLTEAEADVLGEFKRSSERSTMGVAMGRTVQA